MSKVLKVLNTLLNKNSKAMSKVLKVVFVAFMQHCIQCNVSSATHVRGVKSELCIQDLLFLQAGRLSIEKPSILWV